MTRKIPSAEETDQVVFNIIFEYALRHGFNPIIQEIAEELDNRTDKSKWPPSRQGKTSTLRVYSAIRRLSESGMIVIPEDDRSRRVPGRFTVKGLELREIRKNGSGHY